MIRRVALILVLLLATTACNGSGRDAEEAEGKLCDPSEPLPSPAPSFAPARALIDTEEGSVLVNLVMAETEEQQQFGLMHRTSFPDDCGMAFFFLAGEPRGFWMKNTRIPLSVAFFDEEGTIIGILDMEPCERDPCEIYDVDEPYTGALEVNQGRFEEWGVQEGDEISITR